jgi:hypothetical protein
MLIQWAKVFDDLSGRCFYSFLQGRIESPWLLFPEFQEVLNTLFSESFTDIQGECPFVIAMCCYTMLYCRG